MTDWKKFNEIVERHAAKKQWAMSEPDYIASGLENGVRYTIKPTPESITAEEEFLYSVIQLAPEEKRSEGLASALAKVRADAAGFSATFIYKDGRGVFENFTLGETKYFFRVGWRDAVIIP